MCRRTLKWTYVYAYYIEDPKQKELFEFLQSLLEENTEKLADLLENKYQARIDILNQMSASEKRYQQLLDGINDELIAPSELKQEPPSDTVTSTSDAEEEMAALRATYRGRGRQHMPRHPATQPPMLLMPGGRPQAGHGRGTENRGRAGMGMGMFAADDDNDEEEAEEGEGDAGNADDFQEEDADFMQAMEASMVIL